MDVVNNLINKNGYVAVIGLGYVGLPLAVALSEHVNVIGFDVSKEKIDILKRGIDPTMEIGNEALKSVDILFTYDETYLYKASFIIVAVPTPIKKDHTPDLQPVVSASQIIGKNLHKEAIVVYESTVYPGVTEEICQKEIEKYSGLQCGRDFYIGYSPERINPGDKEHTLKNICKIISGMNDEVRDEIKKLYALIVDNIYMAESIQVAEAAKLLENTQRDINIAFMNEVAMIFSKMNLSTTQVVNAMNTKWNALGFRPGLVGGHCIGVDPYYLIYKASISDSSSEMVSLARKINNSMSGFIVDAIVQKLIQEKHSIKNDNIYVLGITFKENCPDIRNSRVLDIIMKLKEYGIDLKVADPYADKKLIKRLHDIDLIDYKQITDADCLIFAVAHTEFKKLTIEDLKKFTQHSFQENKSVIFDIKNIFAKKLIEENEMAYWGL